MSSSNNLDHDISLDKRVLGTVIVVLGLPSIFYWLFQLLSVETLNELLNSEHGSPVARSIWSITTGVTFLSPVYFGLSLWSLRKIWTTLSRAARIWLVSFVSAAGSVFFYWLFQLLILLTGNFK